MARVVPSGDAVRSQSHRQRRGTIATLHHVSRRNETAVVRRDSLTIVARASAAALASANGRAARALESHLDSATNGPDRQWRKPAMVTVRHGITVCCGGTPRTVRDISSIRSFQARSPTGGSGNASGADPNRRWAEYRYSPTPRSTSSRCEPPAHNTIADERVGKAA